MKDPLTRVEIVDGGFKGLAAKALRNTTAKIILIDRTNNHLFQPLLYQVATSLLTPGQIATPIRSILRNQENTTVVMGEETEEYRYILTVPGRGYSFVAPVHEIQETPPPCPEPANQSGTSVVSKLPRGRPL